MPGVALTMALTNSSCSGPGGFAKAVPATSRKNDCCSLESRKEAMEILNGFARKVQYVAGVCTSSMLEAGRSMRKVLILSLL